MKKKISGILIFIYLLSPLLLSYSWDSVELFIGYSEGELRENRDLIAIPLLLSLNSHLKSLNRWTLCWELFLNPVISPSTNIEAGMNLLMKYNFPFCKRFQPYFKGGIGFLYMSQHTLEQSTQYNFLPQAGLGIDIPLNEDITLSLEYRYRHLSNANIKLPNKGIDTRLFLIGISKSF